MSLSRASTMIKASLLSDAASMPLHWIYDQTVVASKLREHSLTEDSSFYPSPACPYYNYPLGVFSPYGDESIPILRSMVKQSQSTFEVEPTCEEIFSFYRSYAQEGDKGYVGRLNHVTKTFVAERESGKDWNQCAADDSQANGIAKVPLIVARYAGSLAPALFDAKVASMVRVLQNNDLSVSCSILTARYLEKILLSSSSSTAAPNVIASNVLTELATESRHDDASGRHWSRFQRNILAFSSSDSLMRDWVRLAKTIDTTPAPTPEEASDAWRTARIKGKLLTFLLNHRDLHSEGVEKEFHSTSTLLDDKQLNLDNGERDTVSTAFSSVGSSDSEGEVAFTDVAKAVGMSCALPGEIPSEYIDY